MAKNNEGISIKMENLMRKEYYSHIILLLGYFQSRADGLRQKHFRFVLMKDNGRIYSTQKMKDFFEKIDLQYWYRLNLIRKGSISAQENLDYYLRYLLKNNVIEKVNRKKPYRYKLTSEFYDEFNKMKIREYIDIWDSDNNIKRDYFFNKFAPSEKIKHTIESSEGMEKWTLFGLSKNLDEMFTKEEINEITTCLKGIEENLWRIIEIKYRKTKKIMQNKVESAITIEEQIEQKFDNDKLASIDFFYRGKKIPEYND